MQMATAKTSVCGLYTRLLDLAAASAWQSTLELVRVGMSTPLHNAHTISARTQPMEPNCGKYNYNNTVEALLMLYAHTLEAPHLLCGKPVCSKL